MPQHLLSSVVTIVVCLGVLIAQSACSVDAWMSTPPTALFSRSSKMTTSSSTTQRNMFDWFNKPKADEKSDEKKDENVFTNMFNQMSPPAEETKPEPAAAASAVEKVEEEKEVAVAESDEAAIISEIQEALDVVVPETTSTTTSEPVAAAVVEEVEEKKEEVETPSFTTAIEASHEVHVGKVNWFNPSKGFGFITPADGSQDLFVHQSEIQAPGYRFLYEREEVEYGIKPDAKGPRAIHVTGPAGGDLQVVHRRKQGKAGGPKLNEK
jgi:cold shock CspA family protein